MAACVLALLPSSTHEANVLFVLATVLVAGVGFGQIASRLHLPRVTGQVLIGILIGRAGLELFPEEVVAGLDPIKEFALGLMGVTVGAHLSFRRLRNAGRRLLWLLLLESLLTPCVVGLVLYALGLELPLVLLLSALAVSTAPATIVAVVKETRSRGVFVKTLVAAVALDNMACIFLFAIAHSVARAWVGNADVGIGATALEASGQLLGALAVGAVVGWILISTTERLQREERVATTATLGLLFTYGAAEYLGFSPLLACLFLGLVQANFTPDRDRILDAAFSSFEPVILAIFFTLAGMHLSFDELLLAGPVAIAFFFARAAGKIASGTLAMKLAGATRGLRRWLGPALVPQAGLAIGLVILVDKDAAFSTGRAAEVRDLFLAIVLAAVTLNEIAGPILVRIALARAGEAGKDRLRLIDFLQEENITTGLTGATKEEVIERMTDLLIHSHHLAGADREALLRSILEREAQVSTCLGGGLFVPHGVLPDELGGMRGVMALSDEGLPFPTPDGEPVHCVVLLVTPESERDRHLQVLALLARAIGTDPVFRQRLFEAKSPAHVYELLHGEETEQFNYFLDAEEENEPPPPAH